MGVGVGGVCKQSVSLTACEMNHSSVDSGAEPGGDSPQQRAEAAWRGGNIPESRSVCRPSARMKTGNHLKMGTFLR